MTDQAARLCESEKQLPFLSFIRAACYFGMQRLLFQFCNNKPITPAARVEINHFHIMVSYYNFHDSMSLSPGATHLLQPAYMTRRLKEEVCFTV